MGFIRNVLLASTAVFIATPPATAQEALTLTDALRRAVAGNVELRRERITIEVAEAQVEASLGIFDVRLGTDLTFSRSTTPPITAQDLQGGFNNRLALNLNLQRALETGGLIRLGVRNQADNSNSRFNCGLTSAGMQTACTIYNTNVDLTFTHPLLRGFGSDIAQANIRRERIQRDQALLNRQTRASNVLRDVIATYWELAYQTQDLAIRQSAVQLAQEQLRVTQAQIDVGRLAEVDRAAVERAIGERQQEVVLSEQQLFFRTLELRRMFGIPVAASLVPFAASDAPNATTREVNIGGEIQRAVETNPQLKSLKMGMTLSAIDVETALSTVRPQLDFVGAIGSTARSRDLPDALGTAFSLDDMTWTAGLRLDMPIQNRTARGQYRAAQLSGELSRLSADDFELEVRNQVLRLSSVIRTSSRRVDLARATVGFAQQNLEAERARFSVGRSTNNDVLLRQQELKSAEIQVVRATVDLLVNEAALAAITGELLERYNVVLKGT